MSFDPRDLFRIFLHTDRGVQVVRYRNLARLPMSLWELRAARRRLAIDGAAMIDEDAIFEARRRNAELVANAKSETRRTRRDGERRLRGYAAAWRPPLAQHPAQSEPSAAYETVSAATGEIDIDDEARVSKILSDRWGYYPQGEAA